MAVVNTVMNFWVYKRFSSRSGSSNNKITDTYVTIPWLEVTVLRLKTVSAPILQQPSVLSRLIELFGSRVGVHTFWPPCN
jgi:hypothetical protein